MFVVILLEHSCHDRTRRTGFPLGLFLALNEKRGPRNRHRGADQWLFVISGSGTARVNGKRYPLGRGLLMLIEHGDQHEIKNTGTEQLRTLNFYVPPAYRKNGEERPRGRN